MVGADGEAGRGEGQSAPSAAARVDAIEQLMGLNLPAEDGLILFSHYVDNERSFVACRAIGELGKYGNKALSAADAIRKALVADPNAMVYESAAKANRSARNSSA